MTAAGVGLRAGMPATCLCLNEWRVVAALLQYVCDDPHEHTHAPPAGAAELDGKVNSTVDPDTALKLLNLKVLGRSGGGRRLAGGVGFAAEGELVSQGRGDAIWPIGGVENDRSTGKTRIS